MRTWFVDEFSIEYCNIEHVPHNRSVLVHGVVKINGPFMSSMTNIHGKEALGGDLARQMARK